MTIPRNLSKLAQGADTSGVLGTANGGTNATATPTAGGAVYGTGTAYAITSAGTTGQVLTSNGASAPTWSPIIPSGTVMLFWQSAAPTGWTQVTTQTNKALRVVSTAGGGTGGSVAFTTAFASQTPSGSVSTSVTGVAGSVSISGGSVSGTTLSIAEMPAHTHGTEGFAAFAYSTGGLFQNIVSGNITTTSTGGGGSHTHGFTNPSGSFSFSSGSASSSFSGSAINLAVQYIDIILCSKN